MTSEEGQNVIRVYTKGTPPPGVPSDMWPPPAAKIIYPFGLRLVPIQRRDGPQDSVWIPATEDDYRQSEAKRLGIAEDAVLIPDTNNLEPACVMDGRGDCNPLGYCPGGASSTCDRLQNSDTGHYYCQCVGH